MSVLVTKMINEKQVCELVKDVLDIEIERLPILPYKVKDN
jgi:hypothetical protein